MNSLPKSWPTPALGLVAVMLYARTLLGGGTFFLRDHLSIVVPARDFLGDSLRSGRFPEWWDAVGMGVPFAANPMHGALYPLAWLAALAPGSYGADLLIAVHILLLGVGTATLSRRLGAKSSGSFIAGAVVMASGYAASMAQNGVPLMTLAWLPWVACAADAVAVANPGRTLLRAGLKLAAFLALALLSGDPAGAIAAGLLALVVILARSERKGPSVLALAAASFAALVLAAVVLVPALYLMGEGARAGGLDASSAASWSMHPLRVLEWAWPQMLGDATDPQHSLARVYADSSQDASMGPSWSLSVFLGVPVLALMTLARQRVLLLASLVFVVLALGNYTPIYNLYRAVFLPEQAIRFPERHLAAALVLWSAAAGVGWTHWLAAQHSRRWSRGLWGAGGLFAVIAIVAFAAGGAIVDALADGAGEVRLDVGAAWAASQWGAAVAALSVLVFAGATTLLAGGGRRGLACALAAGAVLLPLWRETTAVQPLVDRALVAGTPALLQPVLGKTPSDAPRPRLYRNRQMNPRIEGESRSIVAAGLYHSAKPNMGASSGIAYVPGYDPSLSNRLRSMWDEGASMGARLLQLFDIEYVLLPGAEAQSSGMHIVAPSIDPGLVLAQQAGRRPRAFVASRWQWVADDAEARAALFAPSMDFHTVRLQGKGEASTNGGELVPCTIRTTDADRVEIACTAAAPGYAVLLDAWSEGWEATVDGKSASVLLADGLVRAVAIPVGSHEVVFTYRTPGLRLGFGLSVLGWCLWLLGWFALRPRTSAESGPALPEEESAEQA